MTSKYFVLYDTIAVVAVILVYIFILRMHIAVSNSLTVLHSFCEVASLSRGFVTTKLIVYQVYL